MPLKTKVSFKNKNKNLAKNPVVLLHKDPSLWEGILTDALHNNPSPSGTNMSSSSKNHDQEMVDNPSESSLLTKNRYYLPPNLEANINEQPNQDNENVKKVKIPPIILHKINNYQEVVRDIEKIAENEFTTHYKGENLKINTTSIDDFRNLTKFYDQNEINYHTFQSPNESNLSVIVRNVPLSLTEDEIKNELQQNYSVVKVVRLLNKDKRPMPLVAVELKNNEENKEIFNLYKLFYSIVSVEPRRKNRDIPQCTNCQRYGHTKNYCKLAARCVKCTGDHHYSKCDKLKTDKPTCVNCGLEHTANYKKCDYYKDIKSKINKSKQTKQQPKDNNTSIPNQATTSQDSKNRHTNITASTYADALKNNKSVNPKQTNNTQTHYNPSPSSTTSATPTPILDTIVQQVLNLIKPHLNTIKTFLMTLFTSIFNNGD